MFIIRLFDRLFTGSKNTNWFSEIKSLNSFLFLVSKSAKVHSEMEKLQILLFYRETLIKRSISDDGRRIFTFQLFGELSDFDDEETEPNRTQSAILTCLAKCPTSQGVDFVNDLAASQERADSAFLRAFLVLWMPQLSEIETEHNCDLTDECAFNLMLILKRGINEV